jgi:hypothetical protein
VNSLFRTSGRRLGAVLLGLALLAGPVSLSWGQRFGGRAPNPQQQQMLMLYALMLAQQRAAHPQPAPGRPTNPFGPSFQGGPEMRREAEQWGRTHPFVPPFQGQPLPAFPPSRGGRPPQPQGVPGGLARVQEPRPALGRQLNPGPRPPSPQQVGNHFPPASPSGKGPGAAPRSTPVPAEVQKALVHSSPGSLPAGRLNPVAAPQPAPSPRGHSAPVPPEVQKVATSLRSPAAPARAPVTPPKNPAPVAAARSAPSPAKPATASLNKPTQPQNQNDALKALELIALFSALAPKSAAPAPVPRPPAPQPPQPPPGYAQSIFGGLTPRGSLFDISSLLQNPAASTQLDRQRQGQYGRAAQVYGAYAGLTGANALFDSAAQGLP